MYQVWQKEGYEEAWRLTECEALGEVKAEILKALKGGGDYRVTQELEVSVEVKVSEAIPAAEFPGKPRPDKFSRKPKKEAESEATEGGPEGDQSTGDEGNGPV